MEFIFIDVNNIPSDFLCFPLYCKDLSMVSRGVDRKDIDIELVSGILEIVVNPVVSKVVGFGDKF